MPNGTIGMVFDDVYQLCPRAFLLIGGERSSQVWLSYNANISLAIASCQQAS